MVGTHWEWLARCDSMRRSASTGSYFSMTTVVPPSDCTPRLKPIGAEWYRGAGER